MITQNQIINLRQNATGPSSFQINFDVAQVPPTPTPSPALIYKQDFESGVMPPGWDEALTSGFHESSWNNLDDFLDTRKGPFFWNPESDYARGAWYPFEDKPMPSIMHTFLWKFDGIPEPGHFSEICDVYGKAPSQIGVGEEILDAYIAQSGQITCAMRLSPNGSIRARPPLNTWIKIWMRYRANQGGSLAFGSVAWSMPQEIEPTGGDRFTSVSASELLPATRLLYGPISYPAKFAFSEVRIFG